MYKKKGGQITIFILLGIVLVVAFSLFYFAYYKSQELSEVDNIKVLYENSIKQSNIRTSIQNCFDSRIQKGLELISKQGGYIYNDQQGYVDITNILFLEYLDNRINYGILRREPGSVSYLKPIPGYPYEGKLDRTNSKYFGKDNFPGLCDTETSNKDCPNFDLFDRSIEKQLSVFITNSLKICVKDFLDKQDYNNYKISIPDEPAINILFTPSKIIFNLSYKVIFDYSGKIITGTESFEKSENIRLKHLQNFVKDIIYHDIRDIKFDIIKDSQNLDTFKMGFKVSKITDACDTCIQSKKFDDIINVQDLNSKLKGKPYTILFSRQNRIPALDLMRQKGLKPDLGYDYKYINDEEIILKPEGFDPDEEELELDYFYSGWKETEEGYYDLGQGKFILQSNEPHKWTTSELYGQEYPYANYFTSLRDIGYHNVKISVKDGQGLEDYQIVKIFVQDKPFYDLDGKNDFGTSFDKDYASTEDPFTLNAEARCIFCNTPSEIGGNNFIYSFYHGDYLNKGNRYFQKESKANTYTLNKDINNPFTTSFNQENDQVTLSLQNTNVEVDYSELKVYECLPYENPGVAPYPYFDIAFTKIPNQKQGTSQTDKYLQKPIDSEFLAPHICCTSNNKFETNKNKICFNIRYNTCNPGFLWTKINANQQEKDPFYKRSLKSYSGELKPYNNIPLDMTNVNFDDSHKNDIYERTFVQKCSGDRGNVCAGEIQQIFRHVKECPDKNPGEEETCSGPSKGAINKENCFTYSLSDCEYYPTGHSFEKDFLKDPDADGICNKEWRRSDLITFANTGKWICQTTCSGTPNGCTKPYNCKCNMPGDCFGKSLNDRDSDDILCMHSCGK